MEINQIAYTPNFKGYLGNIPTSSLPTTLGKSITMNRITGTENLAQIFFPNPEIGGSISIVNPLRADTENQKDPTIQPTIVHFKQSNVT